MVHKFPLNAAGQDPITKNFVVEASELRLAPGQWPDILLAQASDGKPLAIFRRTSPIIHNRDLGGYVYATRNNVSLTVIND